MSAAFRLCLHFTGRHTFPAAPGSVPAVFRTIPMLPCQKDAVSRGRRRPSSFDRSRYCCRTFLLPCVAFMRSSLLSIVLRMRRFLGVTSSSSSSARNSRHCSKLICLGGTRRSASSEPEARILVSCFFLQTLTVMSSCLGDWPTTMPSYTSTPAPMNSTPRSCALKRP